MDQLLVPVPLNPLHKRVNGNLVLLAHLHLGFFDPFVDFLLVVHPLLLKHLLRHILKLTGLPIVFHLEELFLLDF